MYKRTILGGAGALALALTSATLPAQPKPPELTYSQIQSPAWGRYAMSWDNPVITAQALTKSAQKLLPYKNILILYPTDLIPIGSQQYRIDYFFYMTEPKYKYTPEHKIKIQKTLREAVETHHGGQALYFTEKINGYTDSRCIIIPPDIKPVLKRNQKTALMYMNLVMNHEIYHCYDLMRQDKVFLSEQHKESAANAFAAIMHRIQHPEDNEFLEMITRNLKQQTDPNYIPGPVARVSVLETKFIQGLTLPRVMKEAEKIAVEFSSTDGPGRVPLISNIQLGR